MTNAVLQKPMVFLFAGLLLLLFSAPDLHAQSPGAEETQAPQLLALAWRPADDVKSLDEVSFWDPRNEAFDPMIKRELSELINVADLRPALPSSWTRNDRLHPLIMVFRVDPRMQHTSALPIINHGSDNPLAAYSFLNQTESGFAIAALAPSIQDLEKWPRQLDLTVRYAPRSPFVVKRLVEKLDERQMLVDETVWSELTYDKSGTRVTFEQKTDLNARFPDTYYHFRVLCNDGTELKPEIVSILRAGGNVYLCRSTKNIDPESLAEFSVTKSVFRFVPTAQVPLQTQQLDDN